MNTYYVTYRVRPGSEVIGADVEGESLLALRQTILATLREAHPEAVLVDLMPKSIPSAGKRVCPYCGVGHFGYTLECGGCANSISMGAYS